MTRPGKNPRRDVDNFQAALGMSRTAFADLLGTHASALGKLDRNPIAKLPDRAQVVFDRLVQLRIALGPNVIAASIPEWLKQPHPGFSKNLTRADILRDGELFSQLLNAVRT